MSKPKILAEIESKADKSISLTSILYSDNWSGSGPYTYTISDSKIIANINGSIGLALSTTDTQYEEAARANIRITSQEEGLIILTAIGTKPTVDIPIVINLLD